MTSTPEKKKLSEYKIEDLNQFFFNLSRKISSKIILLEITNQFFNIGLAKFQNNKIQITKVFRQELPKEAIEKSIPLDSEAFANVLLTVMKEIKLSGNRIAISLASDTCYTRLIDIPNEIPDENSKDFLEDPDSGIQIPISIKIFFII